MTAVAGPAARLPLAGASGVAAGRTAVSGKHGSEPTDSGFATRLEEAVNGTADDVRQGAEQPPETEVAADSRLPTTVPASGPVMSLWAPASMAQPHSHPAPALSTTAQPPAGPADMAAAGEGAAADGGTPDGGTPPLSGATPSSSGLAHPGIAAEAPVEPSAGQSGAVRPAADGTTSGSTATAAAGNPAASRTARAAGLGQPQHGGEGQKVPDGSAATGSTRAFPGRAEPVPTEPVLTGPVLTGATAVERSGTGGSANGPVAVSATAMPGLGAVPAAAIQVPVVKGTTTVDTSAPATLPNGPDGTQGILPVAPQQPTPVPAAGPAAHAVAHQTTHPPLAEQLARPLFQLATGQAGTKVMTVQLAPDSLGPVTVRAHLGADGVRIELLAATDAGRDGLRLILSDLKRDLAAQGVSSSLEMSSSSGDGAAGQQQGFRGSGSAPPGTLQWRPEPVAELTAPAAAATRLATTSLDITV